MGISMEIASASIPKTGHDLTKEVHELCIDAVGQINKLKISEIQNRLSQCSMKYPELYKIFPRLLTAHVICLEHMDRIKEAYELAQNNLGMETYDPELIELIIGFRIELHKNNFYKIQEKISNDNSSFQTLNFGQYTMCFDTTERGSIYTLACHESGILEPFERGIFEEIIIRNPNSLIIDIGANYGVYTLPACGYVRHEYGKKVVAVEPDRRVFDKLSKSIKQNGFHNEVILINKAISDSNNQEVNLFINESGSLDNRSFTQGQIKFGESYTVQTVTIDSIVSELVKEGVNPETIIIKIDIQGNEPRAIKGMSKTLSDYESVAVLLEFDEEMINDAGFDPLDFAQDLFSKGFTKIVDINEIARSLRNLDKVDDLQEAIEYCRHCRLTNQRDPRRFMNLLCYRNINFPFVHSQTDKRNGRNNTSWITMFSAEERLLFIMYETLMEITLSDD